ncbi:hypothetical protein H0H92_009287 [Tricholoma furcatifolium]|nr:hypothetical protein H0H92_009287 [Tricholoma furcatifolium]
MFSTPRPPTSTPVNHDLNASPHTLRRIVRQLQLENSNMAEELLDLNQRLSDALNRHSATDQEADEADDGSPPEKQSRTNDDWEERARDAGKLFVLNCGPWLEVKKQKDIFEIKIDDQYDEADRFENLDNRRQGQLRDLKAITSPTLFSQLTSGDKALVHAVSLYMQDQSHKLTHR